jgi:hypothetical protein
MAVLLLHHDLRRAGCPGRLRTCSPRLNRAPLHRLSYWTYLWRGRLGLNQGHPASEAGVLPLNYAPTVLVLPLRFERSSPAFQTGAVTRPAREAQVVLGDGFEPSASRL